MLAATEPHLSAQSREAPEPGLDLSLEAEHQARICAFARQWSALAIRASQHRAKVQHIPEQVPGLSREIWQT